MGEYKEYKLLNDLPDLPKGAVFTWSEVDKWYSHKRNEEGWLYAFSEDSILRNKDWWKIKNS